MDSLSSGQATAILCLVIIVSTSFILLISLNVPSDQTSSYSTSVILMIGDGMGYEHVKLARWVEVGADGNLSMEVQLPRFWMTTCSTDSNITDSAAAATAFATGFKTNNGMLSVDSNGNQLKTITEIAHELLKTNGVISTCSVQHATPAAFMSHVADRLNTSSITEQIVSEANIDVIMGGGSSYFDSNSLDTMKTLGYSVVRTSDSLSSISKGSVLGLFAWSHMSYERLRDFESEPSLADMTRKSLEILSQNDYGFFLMVEGGKIDLASHENNEVDAALDTIAFCEAVATALEFARGNPDIIVIVTADHETGGLTVLDSDLNDNIPNISYTQEQNRTLRISRVNNITVDWSSTDHTPRQMPVYCYGEAFASLPYNVTIDNVDIFTMMNSWLTTGEVTMPILTNMQACLPYLVTILPELPLLVFTNQTRNTVITRYVNEIEKSEWKT